MRVAAVFLMLILGGCSMTTISNNTGPVTVTVMQMGMVTATIPVSALPGLP